MWSRIAGLVGTVGLCGNAFAYDTVPLKYPIDSPAKAIFSGLRVCQDAPGWTRHDIGYQARWVTDHWKVWYGDESNPEVSVDVPRDKPPSITSCKAR
jgi:hypothetical protein